MKAARFLNRRQRVALFGLAVFLLLTTFVPRRLEGPATETVQASLEARPVLLNEGDPRQRRIGPLLFLRGWELTSPANRFGGISSMQIEDGRVTALSDSGDLIEFALPERPGTTPVRIAPLPRPTTPGLRKFSQDTEALVVAGAQGWISFERRNRIGRYRRPDWHWEGWSKPAPMRRWRSNSGAEAMVRLRDGRFLVFAEGRSEGEYSEVLLFLGDPAEESTRIVPLRYRRPAGYRVTDAALLPDGRLLVLQRRLSWLDISAKLSIASLRRLAPGATIEGREIAELSDPLTVDNMEALSVTREGGRTIVRIASDNNYMAMQRNLLLEFQLLEAPR